MPREIEAKYKVASFAEVEKAMKQAGAVFLGTNHQRDQFFDLPNNAIRRADKGLRLRIVKEVKSAKSAGLPGRAISKDKNCRQSSRPMLTFKGPRDKTHLLKIRMEIQTYVDDAGAVAEILKQLGYRGTIVVRKRRSSYRLGNCLVELDQLPRIGRFVEVEGPSQKAVQAVCRQLGLTGAPITTSYVAMVAELVKGSAR